MSQRTIDPDARRLGHESLEASVKGLTIFAVSFLVGLCLLLWIVVGVWHWLTPATGEQAAALQPPAPNLQPSPHDPDLDWQDLQKLEAAYHAEFAERGWVRDDGTVAVPDEIVEQVIAESHKDVGGTR